MRRITVAIVFCVATFGMAQSAGDFASKKANLEALERLWNEAQVNAAAIADIISDRFTDTEFDGEVSDRTKFLADFQDPKLNLRFMNIGKMEVSMYGTTAIVVGDYHTKVMNKGKPNEHFGRFTDTWIFLNGKRVCVASHSSLKRQFAVLGKQLSTGNSRGRCGQDAGPGSGTGKDTRPP
jgi:hypothetical protein